MVARVSLGVIGGLAALWMVAQGVEITLGGAEVPWMTVLGLPEIAAGAVLACGVIVYLRNPRPR